MEGNSHENGTFDQRGDYMQGIWGEIFRNQATYNDNKKLGVPNVITTGASPSHDIITIII